MLGDADFPGDATEALLPDVEAEFVPGERVVTEDGRPPDAPERVFYHLLRILAEVGVRRQQSSEAYQQEVRRRFLRIVCAMAQFTGIMLVLGAYLWVCALGALWRYGDSNCDVPLGKYIYLQMGIVAVFGAIRIQGASALRRLVLSFSASVCSSVVVAIGLNWITSSRTCDQTNPDLYYSVLHLVLYECSGIIFVTTSMVTAGVTLRAIGVNSVQSLVTFRVANGCRQAVRKMPEVPPDAPELTEDGPVDCVICLDGLGSGGRKVLRTPCHHLFHEDCLSEWARNHVVCPICKRDLCADEP